MDRWDPEPHNPYTALRGYRVHDTSGETVGEVEEAVYDAPTDVLKYIVAGGHTIPADRIKVDAEQERVRVPYDRETIESAPPFESLSGAFDAKLREHYGERG